MRAWCVVVILREVDCVFADRDIWLIGDCVLELKMTVCVQ